MDYSNIILELLDRINKLEKEVDELKNKIGNSTPVTAQQEKRDTLNSVRYESARDVTRYMFEGNVYLKNHLVLAIVSKYVSQHTNITCDELKNVFPKSLQGSIGVVENLEKAQQRSDYQVRFFVKDSDILSLTDGKMYVCNQWGILNIPNFLARAQQLGYVIETINK